MFPYPSGRLHVGHVRNYTMGDVVARYKRAQGFNVLHPMGWDAFGLPAENAAMAGGVPPEGMDLRQHRGDARASSAHGHRLRLGREIATCHPDYYRHEQKMFLDFLKAGLAYRKESWVNWDPEEHSVLANEQVIDGRGWRSGALVEKRLLSQWFLRITRYSDELLDALKGLDRWPERVRLMQENWIGRSEGARVFFALEGDWTETVMPSANPLPDNPTGAIPFVMTPTVVPAERVIDWFDPGKPRAEKLEVFTTRPDTLFGASFCAISPNHPLAAAIGGARSGIGRVHRRMQSHRHQRGRDRDGGEDGLRHRPACGASARPERGDCRSMSRISC